MNDNLVNGLNSISTYLNVNYKGDKESSEEKVTETTEEGCTRFIFKGDKGQKVRLGGTFTNWDSWIYELTEITPGNYEIKLPLPPGKYYYAFYTGLESFADPANPKKAYREDGKTVSEITVK